MPTGPYYHPCVICDEQIPTSTPYNNPRCPKCGQAYTYEEGIVIELSPEQLEILRDANPNIP